jgi:protein involved in ribonucleotide reduction
MIMMKALPVAAMACVLALPALAQMTLPGKFEVTDSGSASYTIPISVVPGTAGLEPKLSLSYDSRSGNGLLGVGWSLSGLPSITRCGRTIAQDGASGGVAFDANDRFCLDGQRLVATTGTYGADQTEYRTERESFSKVVGYGTAGVGPSWFKVWTKAGLIMEFGNTADSKIEAQGKSSVRVWALNKTSDTKSNYFTISYTEDNANGEYRPGRIDYTGNTVAGTNPTNSVRFTYEARTDISPAYQAGSVIRTTQRLTKVQAWQAENLVREYRASYVAAADQLPSRLASLQLCDANQICLLPTLQTWVENSTAHSVLVDPIQNLGNYTNQKPILGDFNGDGRTDILWCFADSTNRCRNATASSPYPTYTLWLANGNATFTDTTNIAANIASHDYQAPILGDFNGDGRTDILWCYTDTYGRCRNAAASSPHPTYTVWLAVGDGTFSTVTNIAPNIASHDYQVPIPGDYNGDGITDILWCFTDIYGRCRNTAGANPHPTYKLWIGVGDGTFTIVENVLANATTHDYQRAIPGDYNGDGRTDILWCFADGYGRCRNAATASPNSTYTVWLANNDGTFNTVTSVAPNLANHDDQKPIVGDYNGDGLTDILWCNQDGIGRCNGRATAASWGLTSFSIWLARGDGTFGNQLAVAGDVSTLHAQMPVTGDFDGDGRTDIHWCYQDNLGRCLKRSQAVSNSLTSYTTWLSSGTGTFTNQFAIASDASTLHAQLPVAGDFNGDGRSDILWCYKDNAGRCLSRTQATANDITSYTIWLPNMGVPTKANSVATIEKSQNMTTSIVQSPLSRAGAPYAKDTGGAACAYPCVDIQGPLYVVSEVKSSNGLGGEYRSTYRYAGAKSNAHGRGFLGFRRMTVKDEQTGVEQVTTSRQDYPFAGLVASREKKLGAQLLNRSTNSYSATDLGGTRRYPYLTQSLEESWELSGTALPAVTTTYQYDAWGNATQVGVSTGDGHAKTTSNTYSNDAANWLLGRLTRSEVTSTTPGN